MSPLPQSPASFFQWGKPLAAVALAFGLLTVVSGGSVLFGPTEAQVAAGNFIDFVVWFNFLAGWAYIAAAIGLWLGKSWAGSLGALIAIATALTALAFALLVAQGSAFETRTVGALTVRFVFWVVIAVLSHRDARRP